MCQPLSSLSDTVSQTVVNVKETQAKKGSKKCHCHPTLGEEFLLSHFTTWSQSYFHSWTHKTTGQQSSNCTKDTLWGLVESKYCDLILTGKKSHQKLRFSKIAWVTQAAVFTFLTTELAFYCIGLTTLYRTQIIYPYCWINCLPCSFGTDLLQVKAVHISGLFLA